MFESQLSELLTENEEKRFFEFMKGKKVNKFKNGDRIEPFYYVMDLQVFIHSCVKEAKRLEEIIETCINKFPQIIGQQKED